LNGSTSSSGTRGNTPTPGDGGIIEPLLARPRFRLSGPSLAFDPVHQAIRPDLADVAEAEKRFAPHYARAAMWAVTADTPLFAGPSNTAEVRAQLRAGDGFAMLDMAADWAWGYTVDGHIVGYVAASSISQQSAP
jgi:hypothetical protein